MAIQDENQTTMGNLGAALSSAGVNRGQQGGGSTQNQNAAPQSQPQAKRSFASLGGDLSIAVPLSNTSEVLAKTQRAFQDVLDNYKEDTSAVTTTLIPIDKNDGATRLPISVIVVAVQMKNGKDAGVGYQALLLEGSIESIPMGEEYIAGAPGGKVAVVRTAADADVPAVREIIERIISQRFNIQMGKVFRALATVVPRDFTDNSLTDTQTVKNVVARAAYAAGVALQSQLGIAPLNLANYKGGDDVLQAKLSFDMRPVTNLFNRPVRSDIKLQLVTEPINKTAIAGFGSGTGTVLANISAFVDVIYQPLVQTSAAIPGMPSFGTPSADAYRKYIPRVVLTALESTRLMTIGGQMLALVSAIGLRNGNIWMGTFLPRRDISPNETDLHDIGALNREVNFGGDPNVAGAPIDTKADNFSNAMLMSFLSSIFHKSADGQSIGVVFAVDVSEGGPDSWYNGVLAAADSTDPQQVEVAKKARQAIIDSVNHLSDNNFGKFFPVGGNITLGKGERRHLGYFKHADGSIRDLREIDDYVAIQNLFGERAPHLVRDYSDTILKTQYPEAQRLAARLDILRQVAPNLVVTGFARRVTFAGEFIEALVKSVAATEVSIPLTGNTHVDTGTADRAVGDFSAGLVGGQSTSMYSRQYNNQQGTTTFGGNSFDGNWRG